MMPSVPYLERAAVADGPSRRLLDWLRQAGAAALRRLQRPSRARAGGPNLRMSRGWLDEHERSARKHADAP